MNYIFSANSVDSAYHQHWQVPYLGANLVDRFGVSVTFNLIPEPGLYSPLENQRKSGRNHRVEQGVYKLLVRWATCKGKLMVPMRLSSSSNILGLLASGSKQPIKIP